MEKRGYAVYKKSGKPWTLSEVENILIALNVPYEDITNYGVAGRETAKYFYDDGSGIPYMRVWSAQNISKCTHVVAYEDLCNPVDYI